MKDQARCQPKIKLPLETDAGLERPDSNPNASLFANPALIYPRRYHALKSARQVSMEDQIKLFPKGVYFETEAEQRE